MGGPSVAEFGGVDRVFLERLSNRCHGISSVTSRKSESTTVIRPCYSH